MKKTVSTISSFQLSDHPYFKARRDAYQFEDGKIVDPYFLVELPESATAMALTEDNSILLVEQYRHPIGEFIYELPGGFIEHDETPGNGIRRELLEETGYVFDEIVSLGKTAANPGVLNNFTHLFLAKGGRRIQEQQLDQNEEISLRLFSIDEVKHMLMQSEIKQSMHALCLFYGFRKLGLL